MKPINFNDKICESSSSNCVQWDGPDVPCINLKCGDSVTKAIYLLAKELCDVLEQLDISNYDLKCLGMDQCGAPKDFKGFINLLITKVCAGGNNG